MYLCLPSYVPVFFQVTPVVFHFITGLVILALTGFSFVLACDEACSHISVYRLSLPVLSFFCYVNLTSLLQKQYSITNLSDLP